MKVQPSVIRLLQGDAVSRCGTRKCTPAQASPTEWLVLVGDDAAEHYVECLVPDDDVIRRKLGLAPDVPIEWSVHKPLRPNIASG